ncbi:hypothetical protein MAR_003670, partial [Mya arenaria]
MQETFTILERLGIPGPKPIWVFGNTHEFKDKSYRPFIYYPDDLRLISIDGCGFIDNFVSESVARIVLDMDADEIDRHAAIVHRFE